MFLKNVECSRDHLHLYLILYFISVNLPDPQSAASPPVTSTPAHNRPHLPLYYEKNG